MDTSEKMIAMGFGFGVTGLLIAIGIVRHVFPDRDRARRLWAVVLPSIVGGVVLIILGILRGKS